MFHHLMNFDRVDEILERLPKEGVVFYGVSDGINVGLHDRLDQRRHVDSTFIEIGDVLDKEQAVGMFIRLDTDEQAEQFGQVVQGMPWRRRDQGRDGHDPAPEGFARG